MFHHHQSNLVHHIVLTLKRFYEWLCFGKYVSDLARVNHDPHSRMKSLFSAFDQSCGLCFSPYRARLSLTVVWSLPSVHQNVTVYYREDSKYHHDDDIMIPGPQTERGILMSREDCPLFFKHSLNLISAVPWDFSSKSGCVCSKCI